MLKRIVLGLLLALTTVAAAGALVMPASAHTEPPDPC